MIISHRHKFIFLKTSKTAGTSIEIALSKFCGPKDIITPISPEDEEMRRSLGYPGPQNHLSAIRKKRRFYNHMPAKEVKHLISNKYWDGYYKFCFERNPWDRAISQYYWLNKSEPRPTMSSFIKGNSLERLKEKGYGVYTIDGEIVVDEVFRFEKISDELEIIGKKLGFSEKIELPNAKSGYRKDKRNYREILSDEDKVLIEQAFSDEIEALGYEW